MVAMGEEWEKSLKKIVGLQFDVSPFGVEFLDRDSFSKFSHNLRFEVGDYREIRITGYFSETIREALEKILRMKKSVRLICPHLDVKKTRDRKNLEALEKLVDAGAEIRVNHRLHARFLVANIPNKAGLLVVGSFDFNTECIGKERYDAGIKTKHPDLVKSAIELFEQVWNEPESQPLEDFSKKA